MTSNSLAIQIDCTDELGPLHPIWRSFGYDEINWTYTPRGKRIFKEIGHLSKAPYFIRCHNTFTSGNGLSTPTQGSTNVYHEDADGSARLDFTLLDQVFETLLENNCKPIVELGFMPDALSGGPKPKPRYDYGRNDLWKFPPKDYNKWRQLVYQSVRHYVEKHGPADVSTWYWELWNEPDQTGYFRGSVKDYCKMYDFAVAGATAALPTVRIGGPALAQDPKFLHKFLKHCSVGKNHATGTRGTRLDFISFHAKGNGWPIKGRPFEMPSLKTILSYLERYQNVLQKYPMYQTTECLFDECDMAVATNFGMHDFPEFEIHNTEYYPIFVIRMAKAILNFIETTKVPIKLFNTWAFYFEGKRYFEGNRALYTNENIKKPIFNAFALLEMLGETRVKLRVAGTQSSDLPQIDGLATKTSDHSVVLALWNFDEDPGKSGQQEIALEIKNIPSDSRRVKMERYQIDRQNSNSYSTWLKLHSPQDPTPDQIGTIKANQELQLVRTSELPVSDHALKIDLTLPLPCACLIKIGHSA